MVSYGGSIHVTKSRIFCYDGETERSRYSKYKVFSYFAATITCITKLQTELLGCKLSHRAHVQRLECASFTLDYTCMVPLEM